ncbi:hypothetical protein E2P81_ATG09790 [Venturia nashicola]|uniref:SRR1-like domain-containing protein n=1 Tax=Venturia nashicola TaxID=86259 RepID=A0A4Z1P0U9_9PEZI|nr:hypothetical protein E6O75_ATG10006 [Venturia nashicola]TLD15310.1 hypothetical protein E2P81_ATG09790 [Venturia nashicola]
MPSKPRPRISQHVKRQTVELSDGWSVITSSKLRALMSHIHTTDPHLDHEADYSRPTPERVTSIIAEANHYLERWRACQCATDLADTLRPREAKDGGVIENAICAGLGSLNTESLAQKRTRMWQFVVFLWLVEQVQEKENGSIVGSAFKCYAQEPRFTPTDVEVLKHFDIIVLPALNGKDFVNEKTLLYAPFLPWSLLLKDCLQAGTPAICVSNDIGEVVEMLQMRMKHGTKSIDSEGISLQEEDLKGCERVGRTFLEKRKGVAFPAFEFHAECLKLMVYVEEEKADIETG